MGDPEGSKEDKQANEIYKLKNILYKKLGEPYETREFTGYELIGLERYLFEWAHELNAKINTLSHKKIERVIYDAHDRGCRRLADWYEDKLERDEQRRSDMILKKYI